MTCPHGFMLARNCNPCNGRGENPVPVPPPPDIRGQMRARWDDFYASQLAAMRWRQQADEDAQAAMDWIDDITEPPISEAGPMPSGFIHTRWMTLEEARQMYPDQMPVALDGLIPVRRIDPINCTPEDFQRFRQDCLTDAVIYGLYNMEVAWPDPGDAPTLATDNPGPGDAPTLGGRDA